MKKLRLILVIGVMLGSALGCESPLVLQGTVVSYQAESKTIVIKDEVPPSPDVTISLEGAEIGADPSPGNLVRVAYLKTDAGIRALRLMNLSKQKELMKDGGRDH